MCSIWSNWRYINIDLGIGFVLGIGLDNASPGQNNALIEMSDTKYCPVPSVSCMLDVSEISYAER